MGVNQNNKILLDKKCEVCGSDIYVSKKTTIAKRSNARFCSRKCTCKFTAEKDKKTLTERFWEKVKIVKHSKLTQGQRDCWEWQGSIDGGGYGKISSPEGRGHSPLKAHIVSWSLKYGSPMQGLEVLHACDNRLCVNPDHLMLGSHKANMIDMATKGRVHLNSIQNLNKWNKLQEAA